jgi:capsular exopolysaccharide synthesis family protein
VCLTGSSSSRSNRYAPLYRFMSRFHDALQEANRSQQNGTPQPGNGELDAIPTKGVGLPGNGSPSEAGVPAAVLSHAPWMISSEQESSGRANNPGNELLGIQVKLALDKKPLIANAVDPSVVEHYRRLRTKIMQQQAIKAFRSLLVTSPDPQEGKTVTVLNLAMSFAMLPSFKVLVVDGDLRRGSLGQWLGVGERAGLSDLIEGSAQLEEVVLKWDEIPIHFVVSGNSKIPAGELLQCSQLRDQFRRMTETFDLVLVDSPPVNLITDTQLLAAGCDAVLLVTRAFSTKRKGLEKAVKDLLPHRVIGTILNSGTRAQSYAHYGPFAKQER